MYRLYDYLASGNGYKVRLLLTQLGLQFKRIELDIMEGETRTPSFAKINPNGKIPALEFPDGRVLWESGAILFYLAKASPFLPDDDWAQAQVLQWLFFEQYSHEPNIAVARFWHMHGPLTDERRRALPERQRGGYAALDVMEGHLASRSYFVGERYSIADIALYAYTHVAHEGGFDLTPYPAVREWLDRVAAEPGHIPITAG